MNRRSFLKRIGALAPVAMLGGVLLPGRAKGASKRIVSAREIHGRLPFGKHYDSYKFDDVVDADFHGTEHFELFEGDVSKWTAETGEILRGWFNLPLTPHPRNPRVVTIKGHPITPALVARFPQFAGFSGYVSWLSLKRFVLHVVVFKED